MHRPHRPAEELHKIFEEHPSLGVLFYTLKMNPKLDVLPDGMGNTVFKVYLHGKTEQKEAFLQVALPGIPSSDLPNGRPSMSYVDWSQNPKCRKFFATYVKCDTNPDGSYVKDELITNERIRELVGPVQEFAEEATKLGT